MGEMGWQCREIQRFPALFCENLRPCCNSQEKRKSANISENLRKPDDLALRNGGDFGEFCVVSVSKCPRKFGETSEHFSHRDWTAANGGCNKWGLKGCLAALPGNRRNRPKSPFFCLFRPFPEGAKSTWEIRGYLRKKAVFLRYPRISLNPHLLNPHLRHTLRAPRLKKIKILNFSSEIENFKRAAHQTPIFCGEF